MTSSISLAVSTKSQELEENSYVPSEDYEKLIDLLSKKVDELEAQAVKLKESKENMEKETSQKVKLLNVEFKQQLVDLREDNLHLREKILQIRSETVPTGEYEKLKEIYEKKLHDLQANYRHNCHHHIETNRFTVGQDETSHPISQQTECQLYDYDGLTINELQMVNCFIVTQDVETQTDKDDVGQIPLIDQENQTEVQMIPYDQLKLVQDSHEKELKELKEMLQKERDDNLLTICQELIPHNDTTDQEIQTLDQLIPIKEYNELKESLAKEINNLKDEAKIKLEQLRQELIQPIVPTQEREIQTEPQQFLVTSRDLGPAFEALDKLRQQLTSYVDGTVVTKQDEQLTSTKAEVSNDFSQKRKEEDDNLSTISKRSKKIGENCGNSCTPIMLLKGKENDEGDDDPNETIDREKGIIAFANKRIVSSSPIDPYSNWSDNSIITIDDEPMVGTVTTASPEVLEEKTESTPSSKKGEYFTVTSIETKGKISLVDADQFVELNLTKETIGSRSIFKCIHNHNCGIISDKKARITNHLFSSFFKVNCQKCNKTYKLLNTCLQHLRKNHKIRIKL